MEESVGKRKKARARAKVEEGSGNIRVNSKPPKAFSDEMVRLMLKEPLELADDLRDEVDIDIKVKGGGKVGQAEAARQAIARGLVKYSGSDELKKKMEEYDRYLLVRDARTTEPHKPSVSSKGARKHKQRSKR
ncbi:30S ribosomal protein S9 [candidate division MSBL1 archaeon SCGC-AAA382A20]|uniref:30S ribosomal protein S9 n=1 Tax=candidate division MSBL1 archaeon SCGC-AAA382A20 TaxID=1698280 RepID=A0A133VJQ5_9EURY|nr:30S ribosomal protein S9 [candidate division MSBL1 archaeon SCGC-AAA382A20]